MQTSVACLILPIACRLFSRAPLLFLLQVYLILSKFAQVRLQRSPPRRREDCACRNTGGFLSTASSPEQNLFCLSTSLYPVSLLSMMKKLCLVDLVFVQLHRLSFFLSHYYAMTQLAFRVCSGNGICPTALLCLTTFLI